jgi:hypothetical protein
VLGGARTAVTVHEFISVNWTLNKIMSLQWSNTWEPNIFYEQHQYTILSLLHTQRLECRTSNESATSVFSHFLLMASTMAWFLSLFMTFMTRDVQSSFWQGVPAAVNLSLPHTTSIPLTRTKIYGYKLLFTKKSYL